MIFAWSYNFSSAPMVMWIKFTYLAISYPYIWLQGQCILPAFLLSSIMPHFAGLSPIMPQGLCRSWACFLPYWFLHSPPTFLVDLLLGVAVPLFSSACIIPEGSAILGAAAINLLLGKETRPLCFLASLEATWRCSGSGCLLRATTIHCSLSKMVPASRMASHGLHCLGGRPHDGAAAGTLWGGKGGPWPVWTQWNG